MSITGRRRAPLSDLVTATGSSTTDADDLLIGAKIRIAPEGTTRPAFGFRFATKLPNAGNESGLGLDTTDFFASVLAAKTTESVRIVGNLGLGILGDPTNGNRQNDVVTYGVSFARAITNEAEVVGEINGRANTRSAGPLPVHRVAEYRADGPSLHTRRLASRRRGARWRDQQRSRHRRHRRLHLRLHGLPDPVTTELRVAKAHAYGNDFLFVDVRDARGDASRSSRERSARVTPASGADGLILFDLRDRGATMRVLNADGSPSELSGNGLRCLAALVASKQHLRVGDVVTVETVAGTKTLELQAIAGHRYTFRAALGPPADIRKVDIPVLGETVTASVLSVGNPQCVVLGPLPDADRFNRLGPALSAHAIFPAGTNVEFAHVEAQDRVRILIWERGVGPTTSSGTGSSASAVAAAAHGGAAREVDVIAPGGTQRVEWRDDGISFNRLGRSRTGRNCAT